MNPIFKSVVTILLASVILSACELLPQQKPEPTPAPTPVKKTLPSAAPIFASKPDILFAQTALKQLGFKIGFVDGIWGPRSAKAIRLFEQEYRLRSANGRLSELNLSVLEKLSRYRREAFITYKTEQSISEKLSKTAPLSSGPQLIIVDRPYPILAKANPYSELVVTAPKGSGIYVINLQEGWYRVESTDGHQGYINAR